MAITVIGARISPTRIASPGGMVIHAVDAKTQGGDSLLRIEYAIPQGDPYLFANGSRREALQPPRVVQPQAKEFEKSLQLMRDPSLPGKPSIDILARVFEVGPNGDDIDKIKVPKVKVTIAPLGVPAAAAAPMPAAAAAPPAAMAARPQAADLGRRLRSRRRASGLSQRELAQRLGISASTVSRVERGGRPSDRVRRAVERFLEG